jgi:hypothetical protein
MSAHSADDPALVEAVAKRVLEILHGADEPTAPELLTVAEVAQRYRVQASWVYAHKRKLGAIRLGTGPKARLRFDASVVARTLSGELELPSATQQPAPRRRRRQLRSQPPPPLI